MKIFNKNKEYIPEEKKPVKNYDYLKIIEPKNKIKFHENYIEIGEEVATILSITEYPKEIDNFWLLNIYELETEHTRVFTNISELDSEQIYENIDRAMNEAKSRVDSDRNNIVKEKAKKSYLSHKNLIDEIDNGEVIKGIDTTITVKAKNLKELEDRVNNIKTKLHGKKIKVNINLNEMKLQYTNILSSLTTKNINPIISRKPFLIKSRALSEGYNFYHTSLDDPYGAFFGYTFTKGNVILDIFEKTGSRLSFNSLVFGVMGAGKSTLQKKINYWLQSNISRARLFDASDEFRTLINDFDGEYMNLDGTDGIINPLQIFRTRYDKKMTEERNAEQNYQKHMAKMEIQFKYWINDSSSDILNTAIAILRRIYQEKGIVNENAGIITYLGCDEYESKDYPILSDYCLYVKNLLKNVDISSTERERLEKVDLAISKIKDSYGQIFNGHTDIELDNDLIAFNTKSISAYDTVIYNSILFNILNLLQQEMINNADPEVIAKQSHDEYKTQNRKYFISVDEAHKIINEKTDIKTMEFFTEYMREARKYVAGILFSFHSITDVVGSEVNAQLQKFFEFAQYKFIMKQDISSKDVLRNVFKDTLSTSEIDLIPKLQKGQCLLSINGYKNIAFGVNLGYKEETRVIATGGI